MRTNDVPQGIVVVDEVEAQHVRSIYRWVIEEGLTARAAAKRLNEQVTRNIDRFPDDFMFKLTDEEFTNLKSQFATSNCPPMAVDFAPIYLDA